jgi:hypothetical protein
MRGKRYAARGAIGYQLPAPRQAREAVRQENAADIASRAVADRLQPCSAERSSTMAELIVIPNEHNEEIRKDSACNRLHTSACA